jgi:hypothetical protein
MEMQYIFRWDGEPVGFVHHEAVYDFQNKFLGWVERDGSVWAAATGQYLGLLVEGAYVRRNSLRLPPFPTMRPYVAPLDPPPSVQVPQRRPPRPRDPVWIDGI